MNDKDHDQSDWRQARYQRFYEVVDHIVPEILALQEDDGRVKRRLAGKQLNQLRYSVETIVRDCVAVIHQRRRKSDTAIHLGQYAYGSGRDDLRLTYSIHIERAYRGMLKLGYIEQTRDGYHDRKGRKDGSSTSRLTRYCANDKLVDLFTAEEQAVLPVIVPPKDVTLLRISQKEDDDGVTRRVSHPVLEKAETQLMRSNLQAINRVLQRNWYDLEIDDDELERLQVRLSEDLKDPRQIDMSRRSLYRVFNDPDLQTGGRFYGGWWQNVPREYRPYLLVNGKRMVEYDYSNQHPSILYAQAGLERPVDCYLDVIKIKDLPDGKLPEGKTAEDLRNLIKASFNAMLNAKKPLRNPPRDVRPKAFGLKWRDVSEAIMAFHAPIAQHFYTGVGLHLQRIDSDIAEKVMLAFIGMDAPILPLHDSFLVHNGYEGELPTLMNAASVDVIGIPLNAAPKKKVTNGDASAEKILMPVNAPTDIEDDADWDILQLLDARQGWEKRLDQFFQMRHRSR
jgi:hypothetical protein